MFFILTACAVGGGELTLDITEDVDTIALTLENGEITVIDGADSVLLEWEGGGVSEDSLFDYGVEEGLFWFDAGCALSCGGELTVQVPSGTEVLICLDRGEVSVDLQERANVEALLHTGEVSLSVPSGEYDLDLRLAVGELSAHGVTDRADADHGLRVEVAVGEASIAGR